MIFLYSSYSRNRFSLTHDSLRSGNQGYVSQKQLWSQVLSLPIEFNRTDHHSWLMMLLGNAPQFSIFLSRIWNLQTVSIWHVEPAARCLCFNPILYVGLNYIILSAWNSLKEYFTQNEICWKFTYPQAIQAVEKLAFSLEQIWGNLALQWGKKLFDPLLILYVCRLTKKWSVYNFNGSFIWTVRDRITTTKKSIKTHFKKVINWFAF